MSQVSLHQPSLSFEIFPPNSQVGEEKLLQTLSELKGLTPKFISVTCSNKSHNIEQSTVKLADYVQNQLHIPAVAHLPALYLSKVQVDNILLALQQCGVNHVLALRGDKIAGQDTTGEFKYASDLVSYVKDKQQHFTISGACYPEMHPDSNNRIEDVLHLKQKVRAGCDYLVSQLFFDNECFYQFQENCALAGIEVPILAGIMPIINRNQAIRLIQTCQTKVPRKFKAILEKYEHQPQALREAGLAYAIDQIVDLVTQNVDGIHLYTMNQATTAREISRATKSLFAS